MPFIPLLQMLILLGLVAPAFAQFTHQPAGSTVILDCSMSSLAACGIHDVYGNVEGQNISNGSDPVSPSGGKYVNLPYSGPCGGNIGQFYPCANGGGQLYWFHTASIQEIYVAIFAVTNQYEGCNAVGTTKDWFVMSYNATFGHPIANGFFGSTCGSGSTKTHLFGPNTGGIDNSHACAGSGLTCNPNVGSGQYAANQMVKFQYCLKASTSTTSRDGIVGWSINDVWAGIYTNLNYGFGNLNEWQWNKTWDGYGNGQGFAGTPQQEIYHLRIAAVPSGGCASIVAGGPSGGGGGGGTTPPPPPLPPLGVGDLRFGS